MHHSYKLEEAILILEIQDVKFMHQSVKEKIQLIWLCDIISDNCVTLHIQNMCNL